MKQVCLHTDNKSHKKVKIIRKTIINHIFKVRYIKYLTFFRQKYCKNTYKIVY